MTTENENNTPGARSTASAGSAITTVGELIAALQQLNTPRRFIMVPDRDGILSNIRLVASDDRVAELRPW